MMEPCLTFYCIECDLRVDVCVCDRFHDRNCWDCASSCQVDQRRKALKALKSALSDGMTVPISRPVHLIIPEQDRLYLQGIIYNKWARDREVIDRKRQKKLARHSFPVRILLKFLNTA